MSKDHNSPEWYCLVHCIEIPQNKDPLEKYKMIIHPRNEKHYYLITTEVVLERWATLQFELLKSYRDLKCSQALKLICLKTYRSIMNVVAFGQLLCKD